MVSASSSSSSRSTASSMSLVASTDSSLTDADTDRHRSSLDTSFSSNASTVVDDEDDDLTVTTTDARVSLGSSSTETESDSSHALLHRTLSLATVETRTSKSAAAPEINASQRLEQHVVLRHPHPRRGEHAFPPSNAHERPQLATNSPTDDMAPEEKNPLRAVLQKQLEKGKSASLPSEKLSKALAPQKHERSLAAHHSTRDQPSQTTEPPVTSKALVPTTIDLLPPVPVSILPPSRDEKPGVHEDLAPAFSSSENRMVVVSNGREAGDENNDENANMNIVNRSPSAERDANMSMSVPENDSSFSVETSGSALEPLPMFEHLPVPPCDINHEWDSSFLSSYGNEIFQNCKSGEAQMLPDPRYMSFQPEISERMRTILIDWLFEVKAKFKLHSSTMFLTVNLLDRFLSTCHCSKARLQLLGCTAMLMAAKMEEIWAPEIQDFVYVSDNTFTREDVMEMERQVAVSVNWSFVVHTSIFFARRLLQVINANQFESYFASYLLDLCLEEYGMLKYRPSLLASAIMFLIVRHRFLFGKNSHTVVTQCHNSQNASTSADESLLANQNAFQSPPNTLSKSESNNVIRRLRENAKRLRITAIGRSQNDEESEHLWRWILALCDSVDTMHDRILGNGIPSGNPSGNAASSPNSSSGNDIDHGNFASVTGLNLSFTASSSNSMLSNRENRGIGQNNGETAAPMSSSSSSSHTPRGGFVSRSGSNAYDLSVEQIGAPLGIPYRALRWQRSESSGRLKARWEIEDFRGVPQLGCTGPLVTDAPLGLDDSSSWPEALRAYTSYSLPELRACVSELTALLRHRRAREQIVRTRYEHHEVMRVAHWAMRLYEMPQPMSAVPARVAGNPAARR